MKYKLVRTKRRTVCLEIREATLVVRAPFLYPQYKINKFIEQKKKWIEKHLKRSRLITKKKGKIYVGGKKYNLETIISDKKGIEVVGEKLIVLAKNKNEAVKLIKEHLEVIAKRFIAQLFVKYQEQTKDVKKEKVIYKFYKSKWGSCSAKNRLAFNVGLAMAPVEVIEYVFIHEMAHLKIKSHGKSFWKEVEKYDPNYKDHRRYLVKNRDKLRI